MTEWYGYAGNVLRVDLTKRKASVEPLKRDVIRNYLGGTGYAAWVMWNELEAGIDPLSPENLLIIATGPLTGTLFPTSSWDAVFKSPLTGIWGEARSGGFFGPKLKFAGYDFIIVHGKADKPVYLWICDDKIEIRDATSLWGRGVHESTDMILEEIGDYEASVACIGPAGEKLVRFAAIINDYDRAAGRCGGGAVMGSKNLKAIAVNGSGEIEIAYPEKFEDVLEDIMEAIYKFKRETVFAKYGTSGIVGPLNTLGAFPTKNFQTCYFETAHKISGETLASNYLIKRRACFACPIGCSRHTEVKFGKYKTPPFEGPEYETVDLLGAQLLIDNLEAIIRANYLCNDYGMDTISTGAVIAFAVEAYERGMISKELTDGIELRWGDPDLLLNLIDAIAFRKNKLGNILAEGVKRASEKIGNGAEEIAIHVKGLEAPAHDPRGTSRSFAIQYAVGNRGACHTHPNWSGLWDFGKNPDLIKYGLPWPPLNRFDENEVEKRAKAVRLFFLHGICAEILGFCRFIVEGDETNAVTFARLAAITSALTGFDITDLELIKVAERVFTLERCFNVREGIRRKDDKLPKRFHEPITTGPTKGEYVKNLDKLLDAFYMEVGWNIENGIPTKQKLEELGLDFVIDEIYDGR
ncbi:MAG: aldehyde ferredoxin oxidoreductase family protein [Nitrososphaerota archaeon]